MSTRWRPSVRARCLLGLHLLLLVPLTWVLVAEWLTPSVDANIGYGFAVALLGGAGMPWSLLVWVPDLMLEAWVRPFTTPVSVASAWLNLALHLRLQRRIDRENAERPAALDQRTSDDDDGAAVAAVRYDDPEDRPRT